MPGGSMPDFQAGSITMPDSLTGGGFDPSQMQAGSISRPSGAFSDASGTPPAAEEAETTDPSASEAIPDGNGKPTESEQAGRPGTGTGMPESFPGMNGFPGKTDNTGAWIQAGICFVLLLGAILIVRRTRAHNR